MAASRSTLTRAGFLGSGNSVALVGVVLLILGLVNYIGVRRFVRMDLTDGRQYTVSKSTKKVLKGLDDIVNVTVYFSRNLPPYLVTLDRQVKDLLDEYRAYSGGRLRIQFVDPADDPEKERTLQYQGIPKVQLNIVEKEKAQLTNVYLGMAISYGDKNQVIPVVQSVDNLEYDITSAILKVTQTPPKVAFLAGNGEPGLDREGYGRLAEALRKQYDVTTVDLSNGQPVPADVRTLVVARPTNRLPERTRYEIDQFVMRGGRLIALADGTQLQPQQLMTRPLDTGLAELLAHYGVKPNQDLVWDQSNVTTSFSNGMFTFMVQYPWFARILPANLDRKNPVTAGLESIVLPWTSTLEPTVAVDSTGANAGTHAEVLAWSSKVSFTMPGASSVNPQQQTPPPPRDQLKRRPVAVALSGTFRSFFAGRPVPAPADSAAAAGAPHPTTLAASPATQILVAGDADFATDQFAQQYPQNLTFMENAVDWCTMGDALIGIRSRAGAIRPLKPLSDGARTAVKFANLLGVPLLVVLGGLGWLAFRRRTRSHLERFREVA